MLPKQVTKALKKVIKLTNSLADILQDGKISGNEWVSLALTSPMIPGIISDAKEALKAKVKFTPEVSQAISIEFEKEFDIANDKLEKQIEKGIDLLSRTHKKATEVVDLYEDWEDWIGSFKAA